MAKKIAASRLARRCLVLVAVALATTPVKNAESQVPGATVRSMADTYWTRLALGFAGSILAHESAHVLTSLALGAHPTIGFDKGRPTIYSGIDSQKHPHEQFLFSASGLTTQDVINELLLDIPHQKGSAFERGILAGGIATTLFYITVGRNGAVSDVAFMSRTSSLSRTQVSLIFGGISGVQAWRISRDPRYDHFFIRPGANSLRFGLSF